MQTLLFSDSEVWFKQRDEEDFHVPISWSRGQRAEVSELVGTYLLKQLKVSIAKENRGFYRDYGLGIFKNMSRPEVGRKIKETVKIFKNNGLSITLKINLKTADFLYIYFD